MQCYNIVITLQLTISPCSVITSYNIASKKSPNRIFSAVVQIMHQMVYYHISLFQQYGIFCIWMIAQASCARPATNKNVLSRLFYGTIIKNKNRQPLPGTKQFRRNQFLTSADFLFLLLFSKQSRRNQFFM
jgi:hypothetical protein